MTNGIDLEPEFVQQGPLIQPYEIFLLTSPEHGNEIAIENIPQPFYSPYDLSASVLSENSIKLIWSNDNGECGGYKIYKSTDLEYWYEIGDTTNQEFIDRNVYTEVEYYYTVITYDDYGICSNPSSLERIIITPVLLERPRIYSIVRGETQLTIKWEMIETATQYQIYVAAGNSGKYELLKTISAISGITEYTHTGLLSGCAYSYKMRALYPRMGFSDFGRIYDTRTELGKPSITVSREQALEQSHVYSFLRGASHFEVYRSESLDGDYQKIADVPSVTNLYMEYEDNDNLDYDKKYYYKVKGFYKYDESPFSDVGVVKTELGKINVGAEGIEEGIRFYWNVLENCSEQSISITEISASGRKVILEKQLDRTLNTFYVATSKYNLVLGNQYRAIIVQRSNDNLATGKVTLDFKFSDSEDNNKVNLKCTNKKEGINASWNRLDNVISQRLLLYECKKNSSKEEDGYTYKFLDDILLEDGNTSHLFSNKKYKFNTSNNYRYQIILYINDSSKRTYIDYSTLYVTKINKNSFNITLDTSLKDSHIKYARIYKKLYMSF